MKTCARCGKNWPDSTVQCPEDGASLEAVPEVPRADEQAGEGNSPRSRIAVPLEGDRDEGVPETVVRARRAVPIPPPNFTGARVLPGESAWDDQRPALRPVAARPRGEVRAEASLWPAVLAIAVLAAVVLGGVGYYVVSEQNSTGRETTALIVNARLGVADARARIESLPIDNPLRRRILTLDKWDRELQNFELSSDRTPQIASRAREIGDQAQRLSDEARAAGAPALTAPVVVAPATPQSVPIEPFGASNTNAQPQTTNAAGAEPRNEAIKPPITAAPPTVPPVEGVASPPAGGAGTATPTATPTTTPTTTPPATAPPTRPTTRMPPPPPPPPVEETKKPVP